MRMIVLKLECCHRQLLKKTGSENLQLAWLEVVAADDESFEEDDS
jgi:hypothetical protein